MKSKKILLLIGLLLIAVAGLGTMLIRAWLTDTDTTGNVVLTVGDVSFELTGNFQDGLIVPGQELIKDKHKLTNTSNIDTQIRFKLTVTSELVTQNTSNLYNFVPSEGWELSEGYYYYGGKTGKVTAATASINLTESLKLKGGTVGNDHSGKTFTFNFLFEAKQADHVQWSDMGSVNFTTGLEN